VLVGLTAYLIRHPQSVLNAQARLVYRVKSCDHITDALISLRWFAGLKRIIQYKLAGFFRTVLHRDAPSYRGFLVRVTDLPDRRTLRSAVCKRLSAIPVKL